MGTPGGRIESSGDRSIAAQSVSGIAVTGDGAVVDVRTVVVAPGDIPDPATVAAVGVHNLPRPPRQVFVGRETALVQLAMSLESPAAAVVTQAIHGLGGVGKSELALQHAHARLGQHPLTWWITAEDPEQVQAGLAKLAGRLCPPISQAGTTAGAAAWALGWLQSHQGWLLILDNVTDPTDVAPLVAQLTGGHILITTRRDASWDLQAHPVRLDVLEPGPAAGLLVTRTGQDDAAGRTAAARVAAELGFLPLALDQAAAYTAQTNITLGNYLGRLRSHPLKMYAATGGSPAQQTIARTWDITLQAINARDASAIELLRVLACCAPDNVPRAIIAARPEEEQLAADDALGLLASYSMIALTLDSVSMHRLVQAVIRARSGHDRATEGENPAVTAAGWLASALHADRGRDTEGWPLLTRALLPHAESLTACFPTGTGPETLADVQRQVGGYLQSQGQFPQSLAPLESALATFKATMGPGHPEIALRLGDLAQTYEGLGQYAEALPLRQQALETAEAARGSSDALTGMCLSHLAAVYRALGRHAEALPFQQRALEIIKDSYPRGPRTRRYPGPWIQAGLGDLAATYEGLGRYAEALPLRQEAVEIIRAEGYGYPDIANALDNLAATCAALGNHSWAVQLREQALEITENARGPNHEDTTTRLSNLASAHARHFKDIDARHYQQSSPAPDDSR